MARKKGGGTGGKLKACKGLKGCKFADCVEKQLGKAPKWAAKKC